MLYCTLAYSEEFKAYRKNSGRFRLGHDPNIGRDPSSGRNLKFFRVTITAPNTEIFIHSDSNFLEQDMGKEIFKKGFFLDLVFIN